MMDCLMIGIILAGFGLVVLLANWVPSGRSNPRNKKVQELRFMILLGVIVLLLGGYLVYALAHPDRF